MMCVECGVHSFFSQLASLSYFCELKSTFGCFFFHSCKQSRDQVEESIWKLRSRVWMSLCCPSIKVLHLL